MRRQFSFGVVLEEGDQIVRRRLKVLGRKRRSMDL